MRKQIKKWGDSFVIILSPEDMKGYDLKLGDIVDVSDMVKIKRKEKK
jgi:antitoxin component of MazEF toxin-antitoxin module